MQNVKGTFDYYGEEQALRRQVQTTLERLFESYDFTEMSTTILTELDILAAKYAGGEEILKEMYRLGDQGGRSLGLRYDLTVPLAKAVALHPEWTLPLRRFEIGRVFRDGPVKRGRLREFLQCDADIVGISGPEAELELMQLAAEAFRRLSIPVVLRWNNRRLLGELLAALGAAPGEESLSVMLTLDKLAKIGLDGVREELAGKGLSAALTGNLIQLAAMEAPPLAQLCRRLGLEGQPGAAEARELQELIEAAGLAETCVFDPFLARGLSFYTGTVYEIFDATGAFASSLGGGGRYDAIVGQLDGSGRGCPMAGLSLGMESIIQLLGSRPRPAIRPDAAVLPLGREALPAALLAAAELRACGIRTRLDAGRRKLGKRLASAAAQGIPFVLLIGEDELRQGQVRLKDMEAQREYAVPLAQAVCLLEKRLL